MSSKKLNCVIKKDGLLYVLRVDMQSDFSAYHKRVLYYYFKPFVSYVLFFIFLFCFFQSIGYCSPIYWLLFPDSLINLTSVYSVYESIE